MSSAPVFGTPTPTQAFANTAIWQLEFGGQRGSTVVMMFGSTNQNPNPWNPNQTSPFGSAIQSPQPAFGRSIFDSSTPFCASSQPTFGSTSTPAYGTSSPFGGQSSAFGSQTPTQVASYSATMETDGSFGQWKRMESISVMTVYKDKSHGELRWEDYQLGDKGGLRASAPQSTGMAGFFPNFSKPTVQAMAPSSTTQTNAFSSSTTFGPSSANPFSSTTPNSKNPFAPKIPTFSSGFGTSAPAFSSPAFSFSTSAAASSIFGPSQSLFGVNSSSQPFVSSPSFAVNTPSQLFGAFGNTQSSPLFSSSTPTNPQSGSTFGQNTSPFGQTGAFIQPSLFISPSSGQTGSIFSSSASLTSNALTGFGQTAPSMSTPFQTAQPAQSSSTFSFSNFCQTQPGTQTPTQAFANTGGQRGEVE